MSRRFAVLSTGRQDFGILRSTLIGMQRDPRFEMLLWIGGMHLDPRFGRTEELIGAQGVEIAARIPFLSEPPDPVRDSSSAMAAIGAVIERDRPDAVILVGDRTETLGAAAAAAMLRIPIVHVHGGEESEGAVDNAIRHAITKLSHLHLTTHPTYAARVLQMGEDPGSVHVVPPPGLDNLYRDDLPDRPELLRELGFEAPDERPLIAVTIHPTTLSHGSTLAEAEAVAAALAQVAARCVVTLPNSDEGGASIREFWHNWAAGREDVNVVASLGERLYWGLLKAADLMVSNSSSGLIEAPAARLPVVNVGDRQKGRIRHPLTLDVDPEPACVLEAIRTAVTADYRERLRESPALFAPGPAWPRILKILAGWIVPDPPRKVFRSPPIDRVDTGIGEASAGSRS